MIRDILNHLDEKIGELELPDNTPEEVWQERLARYRVAPPEVIIPDVTPRQFRQALVLSGISADNIVAMIETQPEPLRSLALIEWEYSTAFIRSNPLVNQLAPALGFTSEQLDELWLLAGGL